MNLKFQISNLRFAVPCVAGLIFCITIGCDRRSGSAPRPTSTPQLSPLPTTQELLSGPFQKFIAPGIPLSIQAPKSWKIATESLLTVLEGPTPTQDTMMIQIAARDSVKPADVDLLIQHMRREGESQSGTLKHMDIRNQGKAQVIDQLFEERPISSQKTDTKGMAVVDDKGNVAMTTVTPIHWTVTLLVPGPKAYDHYEVNCIGLTKDEYLADKEILEKIMGSVVYEEALAPTTGQ